jgi:hypothetical protein
MRHYETQTTMHETNNPLLPLSEFSAASPTTNVVQIGLIDFQDEHRFLGIHISENLCNL